MNEEEAGEVAIEILAEFEGLLSRRGMMVPSVVRDGREEEARLYGSDCYELEDVVPEIIVGAARPAVQQRPRGRSRHPARLPATSDRRPAGR